jgi:hypothetical protein
MNMLSKLVGSALLTVSFAAGAADLETALDYTETKVAPEITLDVVQEIFGFNLDNAQGIEKIFLLAVGMDHTTPGSPHADQEIGIPYIVDRGPAYWVSRLQDKQYELEVLVNNALLLMFTKEEIPGGDKAAAGLLRKASEMGYWPADYYVADYNIANYLARDVTELATVTNGIQDPDLQRLASETMAKFNSCAELGFAPCQYRLGFWLTSAENTMKDGLEVLMHAIKTTLADKRYQGILNGSVIEAAKEVVMKGDLAGIDSIVRQEYLTLMQDQIKLLQRGKGMTADAAAATEQFIEPIMEFLKTSK